MIMGGKTDNEITATGFNAFGHPVPTIRQVAALDCAVETMGVDQFLADPVIGVAARYIELDKPDLALLALRNIVDSTGAYRLLAVLCTEAEGDTCEY